MGVKISVCIATWCRKDNLEKIIYMLEEQSLPQSEYEIIVCDSYSNDGTDELMEKLCERFSNLKYINTEKNVLAVKRNIGIEASVSPIVVFMDDDVFPTYRFIEAHLSAHDGVINTVFCGQVRFPKEWVDESNYYRYRDECHLCGKHKNIHNDLPFNKIVVMNLSFKKDEIIDKVGLVNERFIGYGGEDIEFGYRIKKSGIRLVYLEEALAYHHEMSPSIISFGEKIYRSGRDGAKVLNKINPDIMKSTRFAYLEGNSTYRSIEFRIKKSIYNLLINKPIADILGSFLIATDKIKFLYCEKLYRYYLAYRFKEGVSSQKNTNLTLEDVKSGWYEK